jgi:hypothetical protein
VFTFYFLPLSSFAAFRTRPPMALAAQLWLISAVVFIASTAPPHAPEQHRI